MRMLVDHLPSRSTTTTSAMAELGPSSMLDGPSHAGGLDLVALASPGLSSMSPAPMDLSSAQAASTATLFEGGHSNALHNSDIRLANRDVNTTVYHTINYNYPLPSHLTSQEAPLSSATSAGGHHGARRVATLHPLGQVNPIPLLNPPLAQTLAPNLDVRASDAAHNTLRSESIGEACPKDTLTGGIQVETNACEITWSDDLDLEGQHQALVATKPAAEIYTRNLYPTGHGYPCANPCPMGPPIRIGDVGKLSSSGFRALTNLDDCPLSSLHGQLPLMGLSDPWQDAEYLSEGDSITGGIHSLESSYAPETGTIQSIEYRCRASEGAVLAATTPVQLHTLKPKNLDHLHLWLCEHGIDLVQLLVPGGGDPLFIVTGLVTSSSWATAAYPQSMEAFNGHGSLVLSRLPLDSPHRYRWTRTSRQATTRSKASPSGIDPQGERIKDQCLFLRGFLVTLSPRLAKHQSQYALRHSNTKPIRDPGPDVGTTGGVRGEPSSENSSPFSSLGSGALQDATMEWAAQDSSYDNLSVEEVPSSSSLNFYPSQRMNKRLLELTDADLAITHDDDWRFKVEALLPLPILSNAGLVVGDRDSVEHLCQDDGTLSLGKEDENQAGPMHSFHEDKSTESVNVDDVDITSQYQEDMANASQELQHPPSMLAEDSVGGATANSEPRTHDSIPPESDGQPRVVPIIDNQHASSAKMQPPPSIPPESDGQPRVVPIIDNQHASSAQMQPPPSIPPESDGQPRCPNAATTIHTSRVLRRFVFISDAYWRISDAYYRISNVC
ncbi:hypothetical protein BKA70DRAFT_1404123 [Coprinopsis sp. MPI-PUGE-AT-0042]|nr:hypothetical protein BKA70DRAFT_1404123 [Coprinopsis sp. MPI-PUGE-AT-0042]